jgi:CRP-like cAMP-binding protein
MDEGQTKGLLRPVVAHRDLRLLLAGQAASQTGDWLYSVSLLAFVYAKTDSPTWVAVAGIVRLLPYLIFGTLGGVVADRYERRAVMIASDLIRAATMVTLAVVALEGAVTVALLIVGISVVAATPYQPALSAMIPSLVPEDDLAAANSAMSVIENVALALGPAIGGVLLLVGSPAASFALNGVTFLVSAVLLLLVRARSKASAESQEQPFFSRLTAGFSAIAHSADVAMLMAAIFAATILYGLESVLLVVVSEERLGTGSNGVGWLFAAMGVGGLLGAGLSSRLAATPRPGGPLALSMCLLGAAFVGLAFTTVPAIAYVLLTLDGAGAVLLDVLAITLLQRTVAQDVLARVFGIMMTLAVGGTLLGSLLAPVLLNLFGIRSALLITGAMLPILALMAAPRLRALNRNAAQAQTELAPRLELLRGLRIFDGASPQILEAISVSMTEQHVSAAEVVIREGEPATVFFVIASGTLRVLASGESGSSPAEVNRLQAGDYFGEIGLLERIPRTATVQATEDSIVYRISGDSFLDAVTQAPVISGVLLGGVMRGLARTHPSYRPTTPPTTW